MKTRSQSLFTSLLFFILPLPAIQAQEPHLSNLRQLTHGGDNAEAYFSFDGKYLSFQSNNKGWGLSCDQIFNMNIAEAATDSLYRPALISTGKGRTTCSFYYPDGKHILYASTHAGGEPDISAETNGRYHSGPSMPPMIFTWLIRRGRS
ncbi:MAG: hypothetical protein U0T82_07880 [Bacteroidales bacterium]